jgi:lambda repressor-like predicted transcriptional regulator
MKNAHWTVEDIIEAYDSSNITLAALALITGWSIQELKTLLLGQ